MARHRISNLVSAGRCAIAWCRLFAGIGVHQFDARLCMGTGAGTEQQHGRPCQRPVDRGTRRASDFRRTAIP